jgi:hypothetical protein
MRAVVIAALVALASGCFNPEIPTGRPCSESGSCPDGQTCDTLTNICVAEGEACEELPCRQSVANVPAEFNRNIDILYVMDNSGSMAEEQASLALNFNRFTNVLQNIEGGLPNVHIGVISTDVGAGPYNISGCSGNGDDGEFQNEPQSNCDSASGWFIRDVDDGSGGRETNYPGSLDEAFSCMAQLGIDGCGFEQPLESMRRALGPDTENNFGFLRDEALLAIVIVSDEDDCSVLDDAMFDTSQTTINDPLGPLSSFRCFEFGVVCDPDDPRTVGPRQNCTSREDSQYMSSVQEYVDFLKGLKTNPLDIMVAGIIGNPSPVTIATNEFGDPDLDPSCVSASGDADPGVRLGAFLDGFPQRNTLTTICNEDLSDALVVVGQMVAGVVGSPCINVDLDIDGNTPGVQYDCYVYEVTLGGDEAEIPACGNGDDPCYVIQEDAAACPQSPGSLTLDVQRSSPPPAGSVYDLRCLSY